MMYTVELLLPIGGTAVSLTKSDLHVWRGVINSIRIAFPAGNKGVTHVRIRMGGHQIAPVNWGSFFKGDDEVIEYAEFLNLEEETNLLVIEGYNESTLYDHTIVVQISVLPEYAIKMPRVEYDLMYAVTRMIERLGILLEELESK